MDPETQGVEEEVMPVQAEPTPETDTNTVTDTPSVEEEDEFPTEPDKQREAFIKMRQEIKALKTQPEEPEVSAAEEEEVLNQFRQRQVPQMEINESMTPEETLYQMQQMAYQGQATAQQVIELQQQLEDQRLYNEFPELNPASAEFKKPENKAFEKHVAGMYVLEQLKGNKPDLVQLARQAKTDFGLLSRPQQEAIAEQVNKEAAKAEQATIEARGAHNNVPSSQGDEEALRQGARRGDPEAIAELLKRG